VVEVLTRLAKERILEDFNGRFRQECLNENLFLSLKDAQEKVEIWRQPHTVPGPAFDKDYSRTASSASNYASKLPGLSIQGGNY